ncbi:MAG TPA: SoxR reducing system RseC family protein [Methylophilaceae bacterium]|nr:SoxR reducing system RseC family protein [Methylophilaceae bacterium]
MIEEHAVVIGAERDIALLEVVRRSACGLCGKTRGCGISLFGRLFGHKNNVFKARNTINARIGDQVVVAIEEHAVLMSAFIVYGVPLAALLLGAVVGHACSDGSATQSDMYALAGAVTGLVLGLGWVKAYATARVMSHRYQPTILRLAEAQVVVNFKCE